jgi:hypothetical protein
LKDKFLDRVKEKSDESLRGKREEGREYFLELQRFI